MFMLCGGGYSVDTGGRGGGGGGLESSLIKLLPL